VGEWWWFAVDGKLIQGRRGYYPGGFLPFLLGHDRQVGPGILRITCKHTEYFFLLLLFFIFWGPYFTQFFWPGLIGFKHDMGMHLYETRHRFLSEQFKTDEIRKRLQYLFLSFLPDSSSCILSLNPVK